MFEMTFRSGHRARSGASDLSITVAIAPAAPCNLAVISSGGHGRSSSLCTTSNRCRSCSTTSGNIPRVTTTFMSTLLVEDPGQPEADVREDVQQRERDHLDRHE